MGLRKMEPEKTATAEGDRVVKEDEPETKQAARSQKGASMKVRALRFICLTGALLILSQAGAQTISQSAPIHASTPFPSSWDQPPAFRECVIAMKITGVTEKDFATIGTAMFIKYSRDMLRWPPITFVDPTGEKTLIGFSNQYDRQTDRGTGYLRMECYVKSERDIKSFRKEYERTLQSQIKRTHSSATYELQVVLSQEMQKKLKAPK